MATISASPRVAPLRWAELPATGIERRLAVADPAPAPDLAGSPADVIDWRLVGWIVVVFLGILVFSGVLMRVAASAPPPATPSVAGPAGPAETTAHPAYTVAAGDTLWGIAQRTAPASDPRETLGQLRELNGLSNGHVLQAGEVLMLPVAR